MKNTLRGEFAFAVGKKRYNASLTLNSLRLMCQAHGKKIEEIDKWMAEDPLTAVCAFCFFGVKNDGLRKGKDPKLPDFETFCAQALDDDDTIASMMEAVTQAIGGSEDAPASGN